MTYQHIIKLPLTCLHVSPEINGCSNNETPPPLDIPTDCERLNTVGASAIAKGNDTLSRRGSFFYGTCLSRWDGNFWQRNVAPRAHPGQREIGTGPTPFPICTWPTRRLPGREHVPPVPPTEGGGNRGRSTRPPLRWSHPKKKSFIDVFYHQIRNGIQGYTTRAPPLSRGSRGRTGDQTIASPMP
jgi:hypothetical protein